MTTTLGALDVAHVIWRPRRQTIVDGRELDRLISAPVGSGIRRTGGIALIEDSVSRSAA